MGIPSQTLQWLTLSDDTLKMRMIFAIPHSGITGPLIYIAFTRLNKYPTRPVREIQTYPIGQ